MIDRLEHALESAQIEVADEREKILALMKDKSDEEAQIIWEEERSVWLRYLEDEVRVAETNLLLNEARRYHLSVPEYSDHKSWYQSQISGSRFLSLDAERSLQRALLEERRLSREEARRDGEQKRAKLGSWVALVSLLVAILALLKDVPFNTFIIDVIKEL